LIPEDLFLFSRCWVLFVWCFPDDFVIDPDVYYFSSNYCENNSAAQKEFLRKAWESRGCVVRFLENPSLKQIYDFFGDETNLQNLFDSKGNINFPLKMVGMHFLIYFSDGLEPDLFLLHIVGNRERVGNITSHKTPKYNDRINDEEFEIIKTIKFVPKLLLFTCLKNCLKIINGVR